MRGDFVRDEEKLYRSIRRECATRDQEGKWRYSPDAFRDPDKQPSVDRAHLRNNDPSTSRRGPTDAVASLIAHQVRAIDKVIERTEDNREAPYRIDVIPDKIANHPELPDNPAHARIVGDRPLNNAAFKKLKQILSQLAEAEIPPILE